MMTTTTPKRSIFRDKAMQKYVQNREKSVLPRVVAPPVFAFCWLLLTFLTIAGVVAWLGQVPQYITGSGVILDAGASTGQASDQAVAVVLLPASEMRQLRAGQYVKLQIGAAGPAVTSTIDTVRPEVLSPSDVHQRYGLSVAEPSSVLAITLGPSISGHLYAGSFVQAQIQTGSRRLLSLFPVFDSLLKDA